MSNAKYTPAPQHDPDTILPGDSSSYSQAPPSYQATAEDEARLFSGVARGSLDNDDGDLPDDFKFGGSVAEATVDIRNQFIRKVYTILTVQLLVTGLVSMLSFVSEGYKEWIQNHPAMVFISVRRSVCPQHTWERSGLLRYMQRLTCGNKHRCSAPSA